MTTDLQAIADRAAQPVFTSDEILDLFVEACMLAPANAVRVVGVVRKRLGEPPAVLLHAVVGRTEFVLGEDTATRAMAVLCASASADCQLHLVNLALHIAGELIDAKGVLAAMTRSMH